MKSRIPKVLHEIFGVSMLQHVVNTSKKIHPRDIIIVVGYKARLVKSRMGPLFQYVEQKKQLGTGHAVFQAEKKLKQKKGSVLILSGDVPFITAGTLRRLMATHNRQNADGSVLTALLKKPKHYGRIVRNKRGELKHIVEFKDAARPERNIKEINTGIYCFKIQKLFSALKSVKPHNRQGEYYLTDVVKIFIKDGHKMLAVRSKCSKEIEGINTREELKKLEKQKSQNRIKE